MFKFRRLLCVVLVCALVGVAYGAARKIRSFSTFDEPADADAMAIMNIADSQGTVFQVIVTGFTPDTTYWIGRVDDGGDPNACFPPDVISDPLVTDSNGDATWHVKHGTNFPWSNIGIYVFNDQTVCYELRALGNP